MPHTELQSIIAQLNGIIIQDLYGLDMNNEHTVFNQLSEDQLRNIDQLGLLESISSNPFLPAPSTVNIENDDTITLTSSGLSKKTSNNSYAAQYLLSDINTETTINPSLINGVELANIVMREETDVSIELIKLRTTRHNTIGYYLFDHQTGQLLSGTKNSGIICLDTALIHPDKPELTNRLNHQFFRVENMPKGIGIGFFVIIDGFANLGTKELSIIHQFNDLKMLNQYSELSINNGTPLFIINHGDTMIAFEGNIYLTHEPALSSDSGYHVIGGISYDRSLNKKYRGKLLIGFERQIEDDAIPGERIVLSLDFDRNLTNYLGEYRPIIKSVKNDSNDLLTSLTLIAKNLSPDDAIYFKDEANIFIKLALRGTLAIYYLGKWYQFNYLSYTKENEITYIFLAKNKDHSTKAPAEFYELLATSLFYQPSADSLDRRSVVFNAYVIENSGIISNFAQVNYTVEVKQTDNSVDTPKGYLLDLYLSYQEIDSMLAGNEALSDTLSYVIQAEDEQDLNFSQDSMTIYDIEPGKD